MYQFLDSFDKRMNQVAVHRFLNEKAGVKEGLRQGDITHTQSLNLIMQLLCFILEKSLLEQSCTIKDMTSFITYIITETGISEVEDHEGMTRYLVRDALQNKGKPFYFDTYDFGQGKEKRLHVRLIEDQMIKQEGREIFSYHLTAQGYEFLFGTLEVEESLQMSFEQLKLQYAIKKRNFGSARDSVDNLFTLNRKQIQKIREYIVHIKEDIGTFSTEDYEETYRGTFETLNEQKDKHEELYQLIMKTKEQYIEQHLNDGNQERMHVDLENIDYVKGRLQQLLGEQIKLFNEQQTLAGVYDEAISNVLYIGFENRLDIEKDLLERFEENPNAIEGMGQILRTLFGPKPIRHFNFAKAYGSQRIESEEDTDHQADYYLDKGDDAYGQALKERSDYIQNQYVLIVKTILMASSSLEGGQVPLSKIDLTSMEIELLRNVLIQIHSDRTMNLHQIGEDSKAHIYDSGEDFDFGYTYTKVIDEAPELKEISQLECLTGDGLVTLTNPKDKKYLRCHNLVFRATVQGERYE